MIQYFLNLFIIHLAAGMERLPTAEVFEVFPCSCLDARTGSQRASSCLIFKTLNNKKY
jgi:hypothetical protein